MIKERKKLYFGRRRSEAIRLTAHRRRRYRHRRPVVIHRISQ